MTTSFHDDLGHLGHQGLAQRVIGPLQDDEALLLFALVRTTNVRRVLQVGGLDAGFSARNFLAALAHKDNATLYTLDVNPVASLGPRHVTLLADARDFTPDMVGRVPLQLLMLDCHNYVVSRLLLERLLETEMLDADAFVALHDTGLHPPSARSVDTSWRGGIIHQPVERLLALWLGGRADWQRISFHDNVRRPFRHGLTIMQRRVDLGVPLDVEMRLPELTHHSLPSARGDDARWFANCARQLNVWAKRALGNIAWRLQPTSGIIPDLLCFIVLLKPCEPAAQGPLLGSRLFRQEHTHASQHDGRCTARAREREACDYQSRGEPPRNAQRQELHKRTRLAKATPQLLDGGMLKCAVAPGTRHRWRQWRQRHKRSRAAAGRAWRSHGLYWLSIAYGSG